MRSVVPAAALAMMWGAVMSCLAGCNGTLSFVDSAGDAGTPAADAADAAVAASTDGGAPAACTSDRACQTPTPRCDIDSGTCVACQSTTDCSSGQVCDPTLHTCAQSCAEGPTEHDCPASAPTCNEKALYCVSCTSNAECAAITDDGDYCNLQTGECVDCLDSDDCAEGRSCDLDSYRCE